MAAHLPVGTERQLRAAIDRILGVDGFAAVFVDNPASRDRFVLAQCNFDLPVGYGAGRHVDDDRRFLIGGKGDGDRIGAEHALRAPERRDQFGRVGHRPADQISFQCLERIIAGEAEMVRVAHADPAGAMLPGFVHRDFVRLRSDD